MNPTFFLDQGGDLRFLGTPLYAFPDSWQMSSTLDLQ